MTHSEFVNEVLDNGLEGLVGREQTNADTWPSEIGSHGKNRECS